MSGSGFGTPQDTSAAFTRRFRFQRPRFLSLVSHSWQKGHALPRRHPRLANAHGLQAPRGCARTSKGLQGPNQRQHSCPQHRSFLLVRVLLGRAAASSAIGHLGRAQDGRARSHDGRGDATAGEEGRRAGARHGRLR